MIYSIVCSCLFPVSGQLAAHKFQEASDFYTKAIELDPTNAVFFANRSLGNLKLEMYGLALDDASKAIELDRSYLKVCLLFVCVYSLHICILNIRPVQ